MSINDPWVSQVERRIEEFATQHSLTYTCSQREISASFEIGCFHAITRFYENQSYSIEPQNLSANNEYRYLTTPSGNPNNFSYLLISLNNDYFEIRQQVRIRSHFHDDIAFTPDIVVIRRNSNIVAVRDQDYANGKRSFFSVSSSDVIAAHECKSMNPFPELMVSFIGMFIVAHEWMENDIGVSLDPNGTHLAPSLFIGGSAKALYLRMIQAIESNYPINIILGLHHGMNELRGLTRPVNKLTVIQRPIISGTSFA